MKLRKFATIEDNAAQTKILLQKLQKMTAFCETRSCRRKYLLNYFGEDAPDDCASCDVCLNKPTLHDATIEAQKILSTVARLNERFGMGYVTDVLWGSTSEKIREEHKTLSVYGIGKDKNKELWRFYIKELVQANYLMPSDDEFPVLKLTPKSRDVLKKIEKVFLPKPTEMRVAKEPEIFQQQPYEKPLFERLKQLRNTLARQQNVPAYIIFSDSSLLDLATYLPLTLHNLPDIAGFGGFKIEKYGQAFIEIIQAYALENNLQSRMHLKNMKRNRRDPTSLLNGDTKRTSYLMYRQGLSITQIAEERKLSTSTIEGHLAGFILTGELTADELVPEEKQVAIRKAALVFGTGLKILKENLPEEITYADLRFTLMAQTVANN